ncbi:carbohydrate deacetylase [Enterococcus sp. LJL90]
MKQLIINADDFGYSPAVNAGIIQAHKNGVLTSTTLMANMPGTEEAIELSKQHPNLGIGCHLVLTSGQPLRSQCRSLQDTNGNFYNLCDYSKMRNTYLDEEIYDEWCTQIEYLLSKDVHLTHFDSHHHTHFFQENQSITMKISKKYGLPFRNSFGTENFEAFRFDHVNDLLLDMMNTEAIRDISSVYSTIKTACFSEIEAVFERGKTSQILELMVHPAFVDEYLYTHSSFNLARMREVEILTDPDLKKLIHFFKFQLVNYKTVVKKQAITV